MFILKRKALLYSSLALVLVLSLSFSITEIIRQKQQKIIFYSTNKQTAIGFINGEEQILLADLLLLKDKTALKFQLDGARSLYGLTKATNIALDTISGYRKQLPKQFTAFRSYENKFIYHNKRIVIIDSIPNVRSESIKLKVDYLVLRNNPKLRISDLQQLYEPNCIIIDGTNSYYKTEKWMAELKKAGLNSYSVKTSGAYIIDL
jgi:competence protein ComEC